MATATESDYDVAMRLHRELNGIAHPAVNLKNVNGNLVNAHKNSEDLNSTIEISSDSDSDEVDNRTANTKSAEPIAASLSRNRSRSPLNPQREDVTTENQQAITVSISQEFLGNFRRFQNVYMFPCAVINPQF